MSNIPYIKRVILKNFKGFECYELRFHSGMNILTGTNNAGKSTAITALRLFSAILPTLRRSKPATVIVEDEYRGRGWKVTKKAIQDAAITVDNLYHNFNDERSAIISIFNNHNDQITILWPPFSKEQYPFVFFKMADGTRTSKSTFEVMKERFPIVGAIPTLTPLDNNETTREKSTWKSRINSKVSSRYFRNALNSLSDIEFAEFAEYLADHTPEIQNLRKEQLTYSNNKAYLNIFYDESNARHPRELRWAGDGIQIRIQVLFHIWQNRDKEVLLLDEPDVFLHPDLLVRLSQLIQYEFEAQTIVATHSVEFISSASHSDVIWVDRLESRSQRTKGSDNLSEVISSLGSSFQLGLNRALRLPYILFVEGKDRDLIIPLARTLRLKKLSQTVGFSILALNGIENREQVSHFSTIMDELGGNVKCFILLDGDGRSSEENDELMSRFVRDPKRLDWHIWERRDIESYLICPPALCRLSAITNNEFEAFLTYYCNEHQEEVRSWMTSSATKFRMLAKEKGAPGDAELSRLIAGANARFNSLWLDPQARLSLIDPKNFLSEFRRQFRGSFSNEDIARSLMREEIPEEVCRVLREIEHDLSELS